MRVQMYNFLLQQKLFQAFKYLFLMLHLVLMKEIRNFAISGSNKRTIVTDLIFTETKIKKPLVIFVHGYKGYKDWGGYDLMKHQFNAAGFALLKFNFSHNGGTLEQPIDFPDLEAFGNNNYSKELNDLSIVIDWICSAKEFHSEIDINNISLIGHSRGGGLVTLQASKDSRIKNVISWAGVSTLSRSMFLEGTELDNWKKEGVLYIENGRTKQQMPHYIQFYHDFELHKNGLFNVEKAAKNIKIPHLIIHGDNDAAVPHWHAEKYHEWNPKSQLIIIENANHVFEMKQPWEKDEFSENFQLVLKKTILFLNNKTC